MSELTELVARVRNLMQVIQRRHLHVSCANFIESGVAFNPENVVRVIGLLCWPSALAGSATTRLGRCETQEYQELCQ